MNGSEPLAGLLDDPDYHLPSLPHNFTDFYIAPIRSTIPSRNAHAPLTNAFTVEPVTSKRNGAKRNKEIEEDSLQSSQLRARVDDGKKPHLAISQLVDAIPDQDSISLSLPSFVSLSAVERSPIPPPSAIHQYKRPRLDADAMTSNHEVNRTLPRPAAKDEKKSRPVPLLPAMVTGLHEPPPSAGLLPSMDLDARPASTRTSSSKLKVKDILSEDLKAIEKNDTHTVVGRSELDVLGPLRRSQSNLVSLLTQPPDDETIEESADAPLMLALSSTTDSTAPTLELQNGQRQKDRRPRRMWSEKETSDLLEGVAKHGVGKWAAILSDKNFEFDTRTSVDLKDRYRVYPKNKDGKPLSLDAAKLQSPSNEKVKASTSNKAVEPRKRTQWTKNEDEALLKGMSIHGFKWTNIHKDASLKLGHRLPLVLKDRARNLVPDLYSREAATEHQPRKRWAAIKNSGDRAPLSGPMPNARDGNPAASKTESVLLVGHGTTAETAGLTLPRLDLEDDDLDWNNTLPPLLEWEELGM